MNLRFNLVTNEKILSAMLTNKNIFVVMMSKLNNLNTEYFNKNTLQSYITNGIKIKMRGFFVKNGKENED